MQKAPGVFSSAFSGLTSEKAASEKAEEPCQLPDRRKQPILDDVDVIDQCQEQLLLVY